MSPVILKNCLYWTTALSYNCCCVNPGGAGRDIVGTTTALAMTVGGDTGATGVDGATGADGVQPVTTMAAAVATATVSFEIPLRMCPP